MKRQSKAQKSVRRIELATNVNRPIAKVSHTLDTALAERLEEFAFRQRISESSVIEFALRQFFKRGEDEQLGTLLRRNGAGRRRKQSRASAS